MARSLEDEDFDIVAPHTRALLPIQNLHIPKRLQRKFRHSPFQITIDKNFEAVIHHCSIAREDTWINDKIIGLFIELHTMGIAHSIECWGNEGKLAGGLYGLEIGSTFCGESMFSLETDASKIALIYLCQHLEKQEFKLLDSQFYNPHLEQFGLYEIPQEAYISVMQAGLLDKVRF